MRKLTDGQIGYIAGFYEGEGCFAIINVTREKSNGDLRHHLRPFVGATQRDPIPLLYILETTGLGNVRYRKGNPPSGNPSYRHGCVSRSEILDFIKLIYPYLKSPRTRKRAWCVYHLTKLLNNRTEFPVTKENQQSRARIYKIWGTTRRLSQFGELPQGGKRVK